MGVARTFDVERFRSSSAAADQYERQLRRLIAEDREIASIEKAVGDAIENLRGGRARSFVIYGEPQSGKTEMMICLTGKLIDEGHDFILHLLNDSVDLLGQNLGRFKSSGLAPAARNFSEILDPAYKLTGQRHVVFCKKNGSDLRKLIEKIGKRQGVVVIDDEADFASPNAKINSGSRTAINALISDIIGKTGFYIGVTATPARLDLNNTFDNDSAQWVDFPPHSKYTGQDDFFPLEGAVSYLRTLLPDSGSDPKYARQALFGYLINASYLNCYNHPDRERSYSLLIHTSGKKEDHKADWNTVQKTIEILVTRSGAQFGSYTKYIWELANSRFPEADPDRITNYILNNIDRYAIVVLNSERDWKDNSSAATSPTSLFTIIIGGNIVSRGVTLNNLLAMFFTRDVKHKIQQDTYIQRARMFGSRGDYLRFFELTIPETLYADWHRCFVFHRLALDSIRQGLGSLVWLGDQRIQTVAGTSIDRSTVDLDRGEMSFGLFDFTENLDTLIEGARSSLDKMEALAEAIGQDAFPPYLMRYIRRILPSGSRSLAVHPSFDVSNYRDADGLDREHVIRRKGFFGKSQMSEGNHTQAVHHVAVFRDGSRKARLFYKFVGNIQFIKNTAHDA